MLAVTWNDVAIDGSFFAVMEIGEIWAVFVGQFGIALLIGIYAAVSPIALSELFPRGVRCSAVASRYAVVSP